MNSPGVYQFLKNKTVNDYIKMSGGFTENANKSQIFIKYPDGKSKKYSLIKNYKVLDGSTIVVKRSPDTEKFSFTQYATNLTQIYSDILQAYLIISVLGKDTAVN